MLVRDRASVSENAHTRILQAARMIADLSQTIDQRGADIAASVQRSFFDRSLLRLRLLIENNK